MIDKTVPTSVEVNIFQGKNAVLGEMQTVRVYPSSPLITTLQVRAQNGKRQLLVG